MVAASRSPGRVSTKAPAASQPNATAAPQVGPRIPANVTSIAVPISALGSRRATPAVTFLATVHHL
ncbi:MAG: hypothetical protein ACYDDU_20930 [Dermatophilaceae bacterium]